jgi:dihydropteroate synthase
VLVGHSRKSFLDPGGSRPPSERLPQTLAAGLLAALNGAAILRVHDVESHVRLLEAYRGYEEAKR